MRSYIPVPIFLKKIARWAEPKSANLDGIKTASKPQGLRRDFKRHNVPLLWFSDEKCMEFIAQIKL
jgi:hypothetical protein